MALAYGWYRLTFPFSILPDPGFSPSFYMFTLH